MSPFRQTRCSNRNLSIFSAEVKFISRETVRQFKILFGTRAAICHHRQTSLRTRKQEGTKLTHIFSEERAVFKYAKKSVNISTYIKKLMLFLPSLW